MHVIFVFTYFKYFSGKSLFEEQPVLPMLNLVVVVVVLINFIYIYIYFLIKRILNNNDERRSKENIMKCCLQIIVVKKWGADFRGLYINK